MVSLYVLLGLGGLVILTLGFELVHALGWRRGEIHIFDPNWLRPSERALLALLEHLLGPDYRVLVRVRASEVLSPVPGLSRGKRARALAQLERQRFDYLICEHDTLAVRAAIQLVRPPRWRRRLPPDDLERLCNRLGLPLLRLIERPHYELIELAAELGRVLPKDRPMQLSLVGRLRDQDDRAPDRDELAALAALARAIEEQRAPDPG